MSLESAIADLVSASTGLTQSVNVTRAAVEATRDSVLAQETPTETAKVAAATAATNATTSAATTASKLTTAASDYAAQKTSKGLAAVQTSADSELKDQLHRRDPARHPFRGARPSLVMDFVRRECHRNNAAGNLEPVDLNSFMTFTRASTATYVGPDGLIKEAASNVPRYGYDPVTGEALGLLIEEQRTNLLSGSVERLYLWDLARVDPIRSTILSPGGKLDAFKLTERQVSPAPEYYMRSMTGTNGSAGQTFCASVYVHTSSDRVPRLRVTHTSCAPQTTEVTFNISQRTFSSPSGYITSTGFADAGNGWLRIWVVYTLPTASVTEWGLNLQGGTTTGDGVSGVVMYGPQLEVGSFPTSYIPTPATFTGRASTKTYFDSNGVLQTAASGVAVTDHGYVDGRWVSKGLSLEPQATNLLLRSQDFTGYGVNGTIAPTISRGTVLSPTGVLSCADVTFAAGSGSFNGVFMNGIAGTLGTTYTASVFLKAGIGSVFRMSIEGSVLFGGSSIVDFDQATGNVSVQSTGGAPVTIRVTQFGAWYRISLTRTAVANGSMAICFYSGIDGANRFVIYGAQIETGPVATSYIPTTTAQVTRAADTSTSAQVTRAAEYTYCSVANWVDVNGGTLHARTGGFISHAWGAIAQIDDGQSNSARILMDGSAGNKKPRLFVNQNAAEGLSVTDDTTLTSMACASIAGRYGQSVNAISYNGRATYSAGSGVPFGRKPPSRFCVGCIGMAYQLNGYIKQLTYFPRQLSDADLQALTILED